MSKNAFIVICVFIYILFFFVRASRGGEKKKFVDDVFC